MNNKRSFLLYLNYRNCLVSGSSAAAAWAESAPPPGGRFQQPPGARVAAGPNQPLRGASPARHRREKERQHRNFQVEPRPGTAHSGHLLTSPVAQPRKLQGRLE
jgi:hypothetical protein